ncbi:outer membrane transport energization protein ExbD [Panacagrimonas perspica]|uniref:Outer membrane transport energization protein ExbD n=1 Tax=Panacagrimonas perspica TaxID=381431 RepID=A0A4V6Q4D4_9GAMM|nr:biopolymer transporter ExbD [Panacagrimonas perspica]TDU31696.1 outer membrane transport energization protein ExbD [Panacagrimonas perspica]THD03088.1 biopolymer transporter ExbD [Panacagrimonas perspica]
MAMNIGPSSAVDEVMIDINTTPLIDVMLVLLIMLIITIPIQTHAVKLDMPRTDTPPTQVEPPPVVNLEVDFDGTVLWNGAALADHAELEERFRQEARLVRPPEFHIRANKLVEYRYVAGVLASAQRLGIRSIGLVGNEQFLN